MYYRSVNRGIHTTVPGRYTIALVMALGLIAIASGYNGIYLSLSLGIAILIISGLLSERVMKFFEVTGATRVWGEANRPFNLELKVHNRDHSQILYGVECLIFEKPPRFRILGKEPVPRMRGQCLMLDPHENAVVAGTCAGLPRGFYDKLYAVQRTLYPFGLLSKFKVAEVSTEVAVLPSIDEGLLRRLNRELRHQMARADSEREFYCHRHRNPLDPTRLIDWRRSAGRPASDWVVKVFESRSKEHRIRVTVTPGYVVQSPDAVTFEKRLSEVRTAVEVARLSGCPFELEFRGLCVATDLSGAHRYLASFPSFEARDSLQSIGGLPAPIRDGELQLIVGFTGVTWGKARVA
jgi:uncharacterized protein (DUF58 family)